jgi:hypothetical protein
LFYYALTQTPPLTTQVRMVLHFRPKQAKPKTQLASVTALLGTLSLTVLPTGIVRPRKGTAGGRTDTCQGGKTTNHPLRITHRAKPFSDCLNEDSQDD